jgi:hypothetical protein
MVVPLKIFENEKLKKYKKIDFFEIFFFFFPEIFKQRHFDILCRYYELRRMTYVRPLEMVYDS